VERVPNGCLISNSTLSFANDLLTSRTLPGPFTLFDLSNISQVILFNEKIFTLSDAFVSDQRDDSFLVNELKKEKLLEIISDETHKQIIRDTVNSFFRGQFPFDFDLDIVSKIISDVIPLKQELVSKIISKRSDWTDENWSSPNWDSGSWLHQDMHSEHDVFLKTHPENFEKINQTEESDCSVENLILQIFLRIPLYMNISSELGLNYLPDSIRIPLVNHFHQSFQKQTNQYSSRVVNELDKERKEQVESVNKEIDFGTTFEIELPAALSTIIKECNSPDEFIKKAFELRHSKSITQFRNWLTQVNTAILDKDMNEYEKLRNTYSEVKNLRKTSLKTMLIPDVSLGSVVDPSVSVGIGIAKLATFFHNYYKKTRLLFLLDLNKTFEEIVDLNNEFERLFHGKLSDNQLNTFRSLRGYQHNYLPDLSL